MNTDRLEALLWAHVDGTIEPEELAELEALPRQQQAERFLRLWTRMEARQKAQGLGVFSEPVDRSRVSNFDFRVDEGTYASLSLSPPAASPGLRFFDFAPF